MRRRVTSSTAWAGRSERLEVKSDPIPVLDNVITKNSGAADFSISGDGSLVYISGVASAGLEKTLVWVDRDGREEALAAEPKLYFYPRISPDGSRVAIDVRDKEDDLWIWDFDRETMTRFTFAPEADNYPTWTPDGRRIAFGSSRDSATTNLFWKAADGTGIVARLTESENMQNPYAFSPDSNQLLYREIHPQRGSDLRLRSLDSDGVSEPVVATDFLESNGEISPNGRWLAYQSNASGRFEIYVRPFPNVDEGSWQISTGGGSQPLWARDGKELFYLDPGRRLTSVSVRIDPGFDFSSPEVILEEKYGGGGVARNYDVSPDGERFLMIRDGDGETDASPPELILVQNWTEELKRLVPTVN